MKLTTKIIGIAALAAGLAGVLVFCALSRLNSLYQERTGSMSELSGQILLARSIQVDFKKQVQEWKDILLRGRNPEDLSRHKELFLQQERRVQAGADRLLIRVNLRQARSTLLAFSEAHRVLGIQYRQTLERFERSQDPYDSDRRIRGIDREPTDQIDRLVDALETEAAQARLDQSHAWATELERIRLIIIGMMPLLLALSGILAKSVIRPLLHLSRTMKHIAQGEAYTFQLTADGNDELSSLIDAFNGMLRAIQERDRRIRQDGTTLAEREERLRTLMQSVSDGIVFTDEAGKVMGWNRGAESIFGYTELEMVSRPLAMILPAYQQPAAGDGSAKARTAEFGGIRKDGSPVDIEFSLAAWKIGERVFSGGILRDVTEQKKVARLKDEFISVVNHELRTPLTAIRGSLGLVAGGALGEVPAKIKGILDIAHRNSERLARLVNDILDIEKIESGKMSFAIRTLDLVPLLEQAVEANRGFAAHCGVRLGFRSPLPCARIFADSDRFMQVIANLLSNASKFSPREGAVEVWAEVQGDHVRIGVTDRGPGIPDEFRRRIFQKFAQAQTDDSRTKQGQGTGLGLSIAKAIVERMGGQIGFTSTTGIGTTFYFDLPVEDALPRRQTAPAGSGRLLLCLAVGDRSAALGQFLEKNGYSVCRASCPSEAEAILREDRISGVIADPAWIRGETLSVLGALLRAQELQGLPTLLLSDRADDVADAAAARIQNMFPISPRHPERQLLSLLQRELAPGRDRQARIFHVSNSAEARVAVRSTFEGLAHVVEAESLEEGWSRLRKDAFDLLISDIHLRDGCALELLPLLPGVGMEKMPVIVYSDAELPGKAAPLVDVRLFRSRTTPPQLLAAAQSLLQAKESVRVAALPKGA